MADVRQNFGDSCSSKRLALAQNILFSALLYTITIAILRGFSSKIYCKAVFLKCEISKMCTIFD